MSPAKICAECGRETPGDGPFCIHCGARLDDASAPSAGAGTPEGSDGGADVAELARQVRELIELYIGLSGRLAALESRSETAPAEPPVPEPPAARREDPAAAPTPTPEPPAAPAPTPERPASPPPDAEPEAVAPSPVAEPDDEAIVFSRATTDPDRQPAAEPPPTPVPFLQRARATAGGPAPPPRRRPPVLQGSPLDWERVLGRNWFAIVGAVALAIGAGFFLKLAFDNQWIGPAGRVILGIVAGLIMVGLAEYTARRAPPWAQAVAGGGLAILYLAVYASFGFYDLIPLVPALVLLGLTVALGWFLAIRYDSRIVAFLALFGAFLTPLLLGEDLADRLPVGLAYLLIIDLGIVAVASLRRWRWYTLTGMAASYLLFAGLHAGSSMEAPISAQLGLSGVFLIFLGAATLHNIVWRREPNQFDMTLIMVNAFTFFGLTFAVMWEGYEPWFGLIALLLAGVHGLVALAARLRPGVSRIVPLQLAGAALVFLTVAAPLQFTGEWIAVAWAAEGAVLVGLGRITRSWQSRVAGLLVLGCAVLRILILETPAVDIAGFTPVLNGRFVAFVFGIGALYAAAWLYRRPEASPRMLKAVEPHVSIVLAGLAHLLTLWLFSAEAIGYFERQHLEAAGSEASDRARDALLHSLTIIWALYGAVLMAVARWRPARLLTFGGVTVVGAAIAKLLVVDTILVGVPWEPHWIVLNHYFLSFVAVMAGVAMAALLERHSKVFSTGFDIPGLLTLAIVANVIAAWVFTVEVVRFFDHREFVQGGDYDAVMQLTLTVVWALHGLLLMTTVLRWRGASLLALGGLALLGVAAVKLLAADTFIAGVPEGRHWVVLNYYFLAFVVVTAGIATAAYVEKRSKVFSTRVDFPVMLGLVIVANVIAAWVFTAEVVRFFEHRELMQGGDYEASMHLTLTVVWALHGLLLMAAVLRWRGASLLAIGGLALLGIAAVKLLAADTFIAGVPEGRHWVVLNYYFLAFVVVTAGIATAAYVEKRSKVFSTRLDFPVVLGLVVVANVIAAWVFTAEVVRFFEHRELVQGGDYEAAMHATLTVMWTVHAALVIAAGILRRSRALRVTGIVMLAVPVAKLFVFDVFLLERGYRVGAFSILGLLLLAMGLAYQRYSGTVKELFLGDRAPPDGPESRPAE